MEETVTISKKEYEELLAKAQKLDNIGKNNAKAGKISAMKLTPEERRARAIKAVRAREEKRKLKTCNNSSDIL